MNTDKLNGELYTDYLKRMSDHAAPIREGAKSARNELFVLIDKMLLAAAEYGYTSSLELLDSFEEGHEGLEELAAEAEELYSLNREEVFFSLEKAIATYMLSGEIEAREVYMDPERGIE